MSETPDSTPTKGAARRVIQDAINTAVTPERVAELIDRILELEGFQTGYCSQCRQSVKVAVTDFPKIVVALRELLEQAEGRPASGEEGGVTLIVKRPAYRPWGESAEDK